MLPAQKPWQPARGVQVQPPLEGVGTVSISPLSSEPREGQGGVISGAISVCTPGRDTGPVFHPTLPGGPDTRQAEASCPQAGPRDATVRPSDPAFQLLVCIPL